MTHEILVKKVLRKKEEIWRPPVMRDPTERQSMIQMAPWERKIFQIWQLPLLKGKMTKEKRNPLTIISSSNKRCCNSGKIQLASFRSHQLCEGGTQWGLRRRITSSWSPAPPPWCTSTSPSWRPVTSPGRWWPPSDLSRSRMRMCSRGPEGETMNFSDILYLVLL